MAGFAHAVEQLLQVYMAGRRIEQVEVPEVVGQTLADAEDAATAAGLTVVTTDVETGEAEVRYDPALLPLKSNAEPGVIYLRR